MKLIQSQYYGFKSEMIETASPGSSYFAIDTMEVYLYNNDGIPKHSRSWTTTESNPTGILYVKGDADTDESIRMFANSVGHTELEVREGGVWNPTALQLAPSTLLLGRNISLSAIGRVLQINSVVGDDKFLVHQTQFDDTGSQPPKVVIAAPRVNRFLIQSGHEHEVIGKSFSDLVVVRIEAFGYNVYFKTGSIGATTGVKVEITEDVENGEAVFYQHNHPASDFPANTEVKLKMGSGVGFILGERYIIKLTSNEDFSLLGYNGGAEFEMFLGADIQSTHLEEIITASTGTDKILSTNEGDVVFDNDGNVLLHF